MFTIKKENVEEKEAHPKVAQWYTNYINSSEWKFIRDQVIERDKCCISCRNAYDFYLNFFKIAPKYPREVTENLVVHHLTYIRVTKEELSDLILLCKECHSEIKHSRVPFVERIYDENWKSGEKENDG